MVATYDFRGFCSFVDYLAENMSDNVINLALFSKMKLELCVYICSVVVFVFAAV